MRGVVTIEPKSWLSWSIGGMANAKAPASSLGPWYSPPERNQAQSRSGRANFIVEGVAIAELEFLLETDRQEGYMNQSRNNVNANEIAGGPRKLAFSRAN